MSCEIELKLRLTPAQARRLTAHPMLAGIAPEKSRLFNTYYYTPGLELKARGIALRLRRKGWSTWLMTVKGGDAGAGGLAQRHEWEAPTHPGVFDFGIVDLPELRAFLEERRERLLPVFTTDFTRTAWLLKTPGSASVMRPRSSTNSTEPAILCSRLVKREMTRWVSPGAAFACWSSSAAQRMRVRSPTFFATRK